MNEVMKNGKKNCCVFCDRPETEADYLIVSPRNGLLMCNTCAEDISGIVENIRLAEEDLDEAAILDYLVSEPEDGFEDIAEDESEDLDDGNPEDEFDGDFEAMWDYDDGLDDYMYEESEAALNAHQLQEQQKGTDEILPKDIVEHLDKTVIGQERAKKVIATAIYQHERRISLGEKAGFRKNNILLIGPSGSGKSMIAKTAAELLKVPFTAVDATTMTAAGYAGENVEHMLARLLAAADNDVKKAETGIIFIDEIDKLAKKGGTGRDVGGEEVQNALLKLLEGSKVKVACPVPEIGMRHEVMIDTENILFICAGAFAGMTASEKTLRKMGFCVTEECEQRKEPLVKQLADYGMIPELLGRIPVVAELKLLNEDDIVRIMKASEASIIKEYEALFHMEGINLVVEDDAIREIARLAEARMIGARGLRSIFEEMMQEIMFSLPEARGKLETCIVTKDTVYSGVPELIAV